MNRSLLGIVLTASLVASRAFAAASASDAAADEPHFLQAAEQAVKDGDTDGAVQLFQSAIIYAPAGELIPVALKAVRKGGRVVRAGIHMSDIPQFPYSLRWEERSPLFWQSYRPLSPTPSSRRCLSFSAALPPSATRPNGTPRII